MDLSVTRLSRSHLSRVTELMVRTWPATYGATGCPNFTEPYLRWLYEGPNADRNLLMGVLRGSDLVGFKASLFRPLRIGTRRIDAHLATHLTIDQALPFSKRIFVASEMSKLHVLLPEYADLGSQASLAYFEENKSLARSTKSLASQDGLQVLSTQFSQYLLNPLAVRDVSVPDGAVRSGNEGDADALAELLDAVPCSVGLNLESAALWYHMSRAPDAAVFAKVGQNGAPEAFVSCYILDWLKDGRSSKVAVVELMSSPDAESLAPLLKAVQEHAKAHGARGVTVENATYVPEEMCRSVGLMPLPRRMTFSLRSRLSDLSLGDEFVVDVK